MLKYSNVSLTQEQLLFCRQRLQPLGFGGYYGIDWAGAAGSNRAFYRLYLNSHHSKILMVWGKDDPDWDYFLAIHTIEEILHFSPAIVAHDREKGLCIVEEGGTRQLRDLFFSGISAKEKKRLLFKVIDALIGWQKISIPSSSLIQERSLDREHLLWESSYFAKNLSLLIPKIKLLLHEEWEDERERLAAEVASFSRTLLHRDFQSENILVQNGTISFVDVQGSRLGTPAYDLASLLYDPYLFTALSPELREKGFAYYGLHGDSSVNRRTFLLSALQRLLQALGAYGNLSCNKGKVRYKRFVFPALLHLSSILEEIDDFPKITEIIQRALEQWNLRSNKKK